MTITLRIFSIAIIFLYFVLIFKLLKRNRLALKYSLLWLFAGIVMAIVFVCPQIMVFIAEIIGIKVASNGLFALSIFLGIIIMISYAIVISDYVKRVKRLIQTVAILEKRVRELENTKCNNKQYDIKMTN